MVMQQEPLVAGWWSQWRATLVVVLVGAVVCAVLWPTTLSLYARWIRMDEAYSHGFLLLAAVLVLIAQQPWPAMQTGRRWPWLLAMLPVAMLWWVGHLADIILFEQLCLPLLWLCGVGAIWSSSALRAFAFPILFLYFAIPIWDHLVPVLVDTAVHVVSFLVARTDIPVMMQGDQIEIPSGIITVADGCSGERYLVVGLAFGTLAARLYFSRAGWRALIIVLALVLGLVTNWVRIYLLVLIGYATEMRSSLMHDHELFGFVLFAIIFAFLVWLIRAHSDQQSPPAPTAPPRRLNGSWMAGGGWLLLLALPHVSATLLTSGPGISPLPLPELAATKVDWPLGRPLFRQRNEARLEQSWQLSEQPAAWINLTHTGFGDAPDLFPYSTLLLRDDWVILGQRVIRDDDGHQGRELELRGRYGGERYLVRYFLAVGDMVTTNPYLAKLAEIPARLSGRPTGTRLALIAHCLLQDCAAARLKLEQLSAEDPRVILSTYLNGDWP
ncbi:MAG: exosortase [Gammaproteobacteria bacterium]|nr:exosortase [Gammaproteobacteria bacterium]